MEYIGVYLIDLGPIRGMTIKNSDDSYTILINAGMSHEMQLETYKHEIEHIDNHDFDHFYDVSELEKLRHAV